MLGVGSGLGLALQVLGMCRQCASLGRQVHIKGVVRIPGWQIEVQTEEKRRNLGAARVRARR